MIQTLERTKIAQEVLDTHAEDLKSEFSTFEKLQDLFVDVFNSDINSSKDLTGLQNQFANGTLRPEVKFVSSEVLTDNYGNIRDAAFDSTSQTILLSEDLDAAGIESSIEQEIGHWWDVQLNGTKDTTTLDGKPFDEGAAYAERFSEGTEGDNIFADLVYQNDSQIILVDGQETEVEFRPIATWNINGNTNRGNNSLEAALNAMENPAEGSNPNRGIGRLEVLALQEVTLGTLRDTLEDINGVTNFIARPAQSELDDRGNPVVLYEYTFQRNGNEYLVFYNNNQNQSIGNAIVLRNPPRRDRINAIPYADPQNPQNQRGYLAVETPDATYYSVHASATDNNNAQRLIEEIQNTEEERNTNRPFFILGDFNRDIRVNEGETQRAAIEDAFPDLNFEQIIPPNADTFDARAARPTQTLDYMFTEANLPNELRSGTVLNFLPNNGTRDFPSDHFPVVFDDGIPSSQNPSFGNGSGTARLQIFTPDRESPLGDPITARINGANPEAVEFDNLPDDFADGTFQAVDTDIDFTGAGLNPDDENRISFEIDESETEGVFSSGDFNGYIFNFENLRPIENVALVESTNTLGIESDNITFDSNIIEVNVEGLARSPGDGFDLSVEFRDSSI